MATFVFFKVNGKRKNLTRVELMGCYDDIVGIDKEFETFFAHCLTVVSFDAGWANISINFAPRPPVESTVNVVISTQ